MLASDLRRKNAVFFVEIARKRRIFRRFSAFFSIADCVGQTQEGKYK